MWFEHYQQGVPYEINVDDYPSIIALFEDSCRRYAKHVAYINLGCQLTYAELDLKSRHFAAYLQSLGLQKGSRVAIMLPNLLQYPIALFGILRAGCIVVNTNPLYTCDEVAFQMNDSGAEAILVLANFAKTLETALHRIPTIKHVIITEIGDVFPTMKRILVNTIVKYVKKLIPPYYIPQATSFNEALKQGQNHELLPTQLTHQDIAFLQYTGGTTGIAKAAILTHGNMVANVLQTASWLLPLKMGPQDTIITALPLYHIFSLTANCLTFFKVGAKNILITNPRDIPHFIAAIKNSKFTAITGVSTLFNALLNNPKFRKVNFSKLKFALAGGMALQKNVALRWREVTKAPILEGYGLTETSPAVTFNPLYLNDYNGSIGLPLPSTEVSIRNETGRETTIGETGELCVRGPQVMSSYWNRADETALVFTPDGFLKTGDIARMDTRGFIFLVDRKKDMIVVSGFNVYPNELEQVISMHPGVLEVGVVSIRDEESGERAKACIVKRDPSLTTEQVIAHCREHLTAYKVPKVIEFYDELPKSNVGKVLRRALKDGENTTLASSASV